MWISQPFTPTLISAFLIKITYLCAKFKCGGLQSFQYLLYYIVGI